MTNNPCKECNDTGWKIIRKNDREFAEKCLCHQMDQVLTRATNANIPQRFLGSCFGEIGGYQPDPANPSQNKAKKRAQKFLKDYPAVEKGLLFQGSIGLGKTHILCTIGFELIKSKNISIYYIDWNDLVREMRSGEDHSTRNFSSINHIVQKMSQVDLLLFDEVGASRVSPWVQDNIYFIFNKRYNNQKITLCASNFIDNPPDGKESLEQRIGDRIRSRLYEMTTVVEIKGSDFRRKNLGGE